MRSRFGIRLFSAGGFDNRSLLNAILLLDASAFPDDRLAFLRSMTRLHTMVAAGALAVLALSGCRSVSPPDAAETAPRTAPGGQRQESVRAAPGRPAAARPARDRYREVQVDEPVVAITFDDGPNPRQTPLLLDILKERGIRATFFVVGRSAAAHPAILQRMVAEGHEVANHTWDHATLGEAGSDETRRQILMTNEAIRAAVGKGPVLIRPPYGRTNPTLDRWMARELGLTVVLWSVDSSDWKHRDPIRVQAEIVRAAKPGSIILAHDIHATTVSAMPATLDQLQARGFRFLTVSELIARDRSPRIGQ